MSNEDMASRIQVYLKKIENRNNDIFSHKKVYAHIRSSPSFSSFLRA